MSLTAAGGAEKAFSIFSGDPASFETVSSGHINDTYRVACRSGSFILQRMNPLVFPDARGQMENIVRILGHLTERSPEPRSRLVLVRTLQGEPFWCAPDGGVWRCFDEITEVDIVDEVETPERGFEAARAFGRFLLLLEDLPAPPLKVTLPGFHDCPKRLKALKTAAAAAPEDLRKAARAELLFAEENSFLSEAIPASLPDRVCHNDTKVNNVLFDAQSGKAVCVVDLDTAMPGKVPADFGDLARSAASSAREDSRDLDAVGARPMVLESLCAGYLEGAGNFLLPEERSVLADAPAGIAFELGVRFLTDFLKGDLYFKTSRPGQNLDRCRVQFKLAQSLFEERSRLRSWLAGRAPSSKKNRKESSR